MAYYLIDFNSNVDDNAIQEYLTANQCTQIKVFDRLDKTYHVQAEIEPPLTDIVHTVIDDDNSHLNLLTTVEVPLVTVSESTTIDSTNNNNWWKCYSLRDIDLDQPSINVNKFGQGINVYMVDSGIDLNHSEFVDRDINLIYSFTGEFTDNNGHGTALSSVIIGKTCGLTNATLNVVKIFDQNIPTKQSDLLHALDAILADASISPNKVSIVNLSWSVSKNSFIESKIQCLINAGIMIVAASGNSGVPIADVTPASMADVFTIGSYSENFLPSDFSNYSNSAISCTLNLNNFGSLDSWAPGENIYAATPGNNGFSAVSGTSISAAIYSGSIAYTMSQFLLSTGELPISYKTTNGTNIPNFQTISSFDRNGLLDLSDPKYSSSVNKICTYTELDSQTIIDPVNRLSTPLKVVANVNSPVYKKLIFPAIVKSYEILGELPSGVVVDGNFININIKNEPISTQHVDEYITPIRYDLRDNSASITRNIIVVLVGSEFDANSLSEDDPILDLVLALNCFNQPQDGACGRHTCSGSSSCQSVGAKKCGCVGN
jgi:subtilisin family serine protease